VKINTIIDKYNNVQDTSFIDEYSLEELENDYDFLINLQSEMESLDKLKK
jgi:hypothetical protein